MSGSGDGLDLLKPFLPGLEAALEDPDVSEIMINGRATCGWKPTGACGRSPRPRWTPRRSTGPLFILPAPRAGPGRVPGP